MSAQIDEQFAHTPALREPSRLAAPPSSTTPFLAREGGQRVTWAGSPPLIVDHLAKTYEWKPVLRGVSFTLGPGKTLALLGPNGAGKTTLLRILATLTRPSRGAASLAGLDVVRDAHALRSLVGYVGHAPLLYEELSAEENLLFFARMYGLRDGLCRAAELLERVGLRTQAHEQTRTLSRGQMQRIALARAILHTPRVLLLDEPDAGLDDTGLTVLDGILGEWRAAGRTTILATHNHERGLSLADDALVLVGGRVAHVGPAADLSVEGVRDLYQAASRSRGGPA